MVRPGGDGGHDPARERRKDPAHAGSGRITPGRAPRAPGGKREKGYSVGVAPQSRSPDHGTRSPQRRRVESGYRTAPVGIAGPGLVPFPVSSPRAPRTEGACGRVPHHSGAFRHLRSAGRSSGSSSRRLCCSKTAIVRVQSSPAGSTPRELIISGFSACMVFSSSGAPGGRVRSSGPGR